MTPIVTESFDANIHFTETKEGHQFGIALDNDWAVKQLRKIVATELLGNTTIPDLLFERADSSHIKIDTDYLGRARNPHNPFPDPFERPTG